MKILITGTAGFIGFHFAKRLIQLGFDVVGLDNINDYYDVNLKFARLSETGINKNDISYGKLIYSSTFKNYSFIKLNIHDRENIEELFKIHQFDYVCHLAAQAGVRYSLSHPETYIESNLLGFFNLIEGAKKNHIKHFIYASSSSVYGLNKNMPFSVKHNVDHPISLYAATKKSNELTAHAYSYIHNLPTTGLRFFTVYGPWGRPDMALFLFSKAISENKPIEVYNNGDMLRDFTYIDDIIDGIVHVIKTPANPNKNWNGQNPDPSSSSAPYRIYNIGNNDPVKLTDFIQAVEEAFGKKAKKIFLPMQPGDMKATYADVNSLTKDFNYKPSTSVKTGIKEFVKWYRSFYKV